MITETVEVDSATAVDWLDQLVNGFKILSLTTISKSGLAIDISYFYCSVREPLKLFDSELIIQMDIGTPHSRQKFIYLNKSVNMLWELENKQLALIRGNTLLGVTLSRVPPDHEFDSLKYSFAVIGS